MSGGTAAPILAQTGLGIASVIASNITTNVMGTALNGGSFGDCILAGTKGAVFGGMSAMASAGIGDVFGGVESLFT